MLRIGRRVRSPDGCQALCTGTRSWRHCIEAMALLITRQEVHRQLAEGTRIPDDLTGKHVRHLPSPSLGLPSADRVSGERIACRRNRSFPCKPKHSEVSRVAKGKRRSKKTRQTGKASSARKPGREQGRTCRECSRKSCLALGALSIPSFFKTYGMVAPFNTIVSIATFVGSRKMPTRQILRGTLMALRFVVRNVSAPGRCRAYGMQHNCSISCVASGAPC